MFERIPMKPITSNVHSKSNLLVKSRLPGLDSLRAIAALAVIFGHIEIFKNRAAAPNLLEYFAFRGNLIGHLGVIFFFVLSGFLITLLMFREIDLKNTLDIKSFYIRRIRRIWPLYYGLLIMSALLTSFIPSLTTLLLCLTILPNIAEVFYQSWTPSPQIWSIGVEEQFYLFWPFFILLFRKHILKSLTLFFVLYSLLPHLLQWFFLHYTSHDYTAIINNLFIVHGIKFNCMALGGIIAYLFHKNLLQSNKVLTHLTTFAWYLALILWCFGFSLPYFNDEFYALLFAIIILGVSRKIIDHSLLRNRSINYLGKISYGLYMYHWLLLILITPMFKDFLITTPILGSIIFYLVIIATTISVSHLSYHFFEKRFLKSK